MRRILSFFGNGRTSRARATLPVGYDTAYDLCHEALHEVLHCMSTDRDRDSMKLTAVCQYRTIGSGTNPAFVFEFAVGDGFLTVTITSPAPYPGTLSGKVKEFRDDGVRDLAAYLEAHATARR